MAGTQTAKFQKEVFQGAQRMGETDRLRWFLEWQKPGQPPLPATFPSGWLFCFPVTSGRWQDELALPIILALLKDQSGDPFIFPAITSVDVLEKEGFLWYDFGEEPKYKNPVDHVCGICGMVSRTELFTPPDCDCDRLEVPESRLQEIGLVKARYTQGHYIYEREP